MKIKKRYISNAIQWQIQDFPWGGVHPLGGHGPPTWALFGENVCENERIGSHRGACTGHSPLDLPMQYEVSMTVCMDRLANQRKESKWLLFKNYMSESLNILYAYMGDICIHLYKYEVSMSNSVASELCTDADANDIDAIAMMLTPMQRWTKHDCTRFFG